MIISSNFNRWYRGFIIRDIKKRLDYPLIVGNFKCNIHQLSEDSIHQLFKMLTSYPKETKIVNDELKILAKSTTDITSKELVQHLEEMRIILSDNGFVLSVDENKWNRLIGEIK